MLISSLAQGQEETDFSTEKDETRQRYNLYEDMRQARWRDNTVRWFYDPAGSPFGTGQTLQALKRAALAWESGGDVRFEYMGTLSGEVTGEAVVVDWMAEDEFTRNYGAEAIAHTEVFWNGTLVTRGRIYLNRADFADGARTAAELQGLMTHEFGHALGISHSDVFASVMYYPYRDLLYQRSLREDDISALQALYPGGQNDSGCRVPAATVSVSGGLDLHLPSLRYYPSGRDSRDIWAYLQSAGRDADGALLFALVEQGENPAPQCVTLQSGTVAQDLRVNLPLLEYRRDWKTRQLWATLVYAGLDAAGRHQWRLNGYGPR